MDDDDFRAFCSAWVSAWAMYDKTPSGDVLNMAFEAMRPWSIDQIKQGLADHVRDPKSGQFPPKPADIVRQIEGTDEDRRQIDDAQAMAAWQKAHEAVVRVGPYESCPITDERAKAAIEDAGGWVQFCAMKSDELPHVRRQFIAAYKALEAPGTPRSALGIHDRANGRARVSSEACSVSQSLPDLGGAA